ncbi:methylenetetrahydrofolate reductase (NADPH) [Enterococcus sp. PF1-24]|uniref:methylenetetrahydrofolate reductase [NAD(P)H] n=1 Tax=unclassified Enterococcus TaxID=2608891 RepID=UPI002473CA83|nr:MULTISPECIES: methylenetetrahydrofolate reductase [NAD(P)H] [unclassified Enterococcus]MDH6365715.1 methylenetetrahydrofolate reductase (NADPH) [Enterococcus sp. PFB1-1]MDH6402815.1 methylenetetrahydrofolate reductase (NADPH) [Enterococcus sp. PF1-24]
MKIKDFYQQKKPVVSFELFPPKKESGIETIYQTLAELKDIQPDFISVTYGAGGSRQDNRTLEIASLVKNQYGIEPLHHLTCVVNSEEEIQQLLTDIRKENIENVLALRGDMPAGQEDCQSDFTYAKELITTVKELTDFSVGAACYPEGHIDQLASSENIQHLQEKVDAGADFFISQLFFDNDSFYRLVDSAQKAQIFTPISAGVMPILSRAQVEKMIFMCGTSLPSKLIKLIHKYEHSLVDLRKAGLEYALEQIDDLVAHGVAGVHVYAMNRPTVAKSAIQQLRGGVDV